MIGCVPAGTVDALGIYIECATGVDKHQHRGVTVVGSREAVGRAHCVAGTQPIGGGLVANHAGGRYTSSPRCLNLDASELMLSGTTTPLAGTAPLSCIAVRVARSVWLGSVAPVSWFQTVCSVGGSSRPTR